MKSTINDLDIEDFALCELLTTHSYSSSTVSSELNIKKKHKPDPRCKEVY